MIQDVVLMVFQLTRNIHKFTFPERMTNVH